MKYSVTSVCLPAMDMAAQCNFLKRLGYDGIELRARRISDEMRAKAEPSTWGYHVNDVTPENLAEKAPELRRILGLGLRDWRRICPVLIWSSSSTLWKARWPSVRR